MASPALTTALKDLLAALNAGRRVPRERAALRAAIAAAPARDTGLRFTPLFLEAAADLLADGCVASRAFAQSFKLSGPLAYESSQVLWAAGRVVAAAGPGSFAARQVLRHTRLLR